MDDMKLYQYTEDFQSLINYMEDNDLSYEDIKDTIEAIQLSAEDKIANTGRVLRKKKDDLDTLGKHKARIEEMIIKEKKNITSLQQYLLFHMNQLKVKKVEKEDIKVSVRNSEKLIPTNIDKFPKEFLKEETTVKPNIKDFKTYYKALSPEEQLKIDYAHIEQSQSINIK